MDEVVHHKTALRRLGSLSWPQTATRPNWNQADGTLATGRQEGNSSIEPRVPATFVCYWSYPRDHGHDTGRQATGNWITLLLPSPYVRARRHCSEYSSKLYLVTTLGFSLSFFWQPVIIKWELVRYPTQIVGVREPHIPLKWPLWAGQSDAGLLRPIHVRRPCWGRVRAGNVSSPLQHGRKIFLMKKNYEFICKSVLEHSGYKKRLLTCPTLPCLTVCLTSSTTHLYYGATVPLAPLPANDALRLNLL